MFVLYETPAGYSLFKVNDTKRYNKAKADDLFKKFDVLKSVELVHFQPFADTADAVAAITASQEGKITDRLSQFLERAKDSAIAVAEKNLAVSLKDTIDGVIHDDKTQELFRGIREHLPELLESSLSESDLKSMQLGLSHALGRYKLKFSADKVDTMVIQGIGLLDDLDKEVNIYGMRVKEWYGWHFPELQAIVSDNCAYSTLVTMVGERRGFQNADLTGVFDDDDEAMISAVREAADVSMGTDVTELDIIHIQSLADQVLSLSEYRKQLFEYLQNRMQALAPNLTALTGELVGARLLAHSGSLMNLAKQPASTIQILGAEKALFRALKTKHDTPKYGLIYHASLVGQAAPKHKGKISRVLAAKCALAVRVDALTEDDLDATVGIEGRQKVEMRLRQLEGGAAPSLGASITAKKTGVYHPVAAKTASTSVQYNSTSDVMQVDTPSSRKESSDSEEKKKKKKDKKNKKDKDGDKKRKHDEGDAEEKANGGDNNDNEKKSAKKLKKEKKSAKKEKK